jgi:hypothetical protein
MDINEGIDRLLSSLDKLDIEIARYWEESDEEQAELRELCDQSIETISSKIGNQPYYQGLGERQLASVDYHGAYFREASHALFIALWDRGISVAAIIWSGHDANTLQIFHVCQSVKKTSENH